MPQLFVKGGAQDFGYLVPDVNPNKGDQDKNCRPSVLTCNNQCAEQSEVHIEDYIQEQRNHDINVD